MTQSTRWTLTARWALGALCGWTVFLWANRLSNAWSSSTEGTAAKVSSTVLAVSFLGFAAGGVWALVRAWRRPDTPEPRRFVLAFCGWTIAVWVVRIVAIALADHSIPFKAVHAVLGVVSIALAAIVARSSTRSSAEVVSTAELGHR